MEEDRMQENIFFSLVVATVGRTKELQQFLLSVAELPSKNFEVILVDQNSDDRVADLVPLFTDKLHLVHCKIEQKNASKARNAGAALATGSWIGFPDDDCEYTPDTMQKVQGVITEHAPDVVTGTVLDFDGRPLNRFLLNRCKVSLLNFIGKVSEPALFIRKEIFEQLGGFNEDFGPGGKYFSSESYELAVRALTQKIDIQFDAGIHILHPRVMPPFPDSYLKREYGYSYGFGMVLRKHFGWWAAVYLSKYALVFTTKLFRFTGTRRAHAYVTASGLWDGLWHRKPKTAGCASLTPPVLAPLAPAFNLPKPAADAIPQTQEAGR
ncbi:glycosyltransferase family 2 protein [Rufibacter quisquiliarum]